MNARFTTLPAITQTLATQSDKTRSAIPDLKDRVCAERLTDHGDPGDAPTVPPPLEEVANPARPSAAEEARTVAATTDVGTLASLTRGRRPVGVVRHLRSARRLPRAVCVAEWPSTAATSHNDPRASIAIVAPNPPVRSAGSAPASPSPGYVYRPEGDELAAAPRRRTKAAIPGSARIYIDFSDFFALGTARAAGAAASGGYGRMDSATAESYAPATVDPVTPSAGRAIESR